MNWAQLSVRCNACGECPIRTGTDIQYVRHTFGHCVREMCSIICVRFLWASDDKSIRKFYDYLKIAFSVCFAEEICPEIVYGIQVKPFYNRNLSYGTTNANL